MWVESQNRAKGNYRPTTLLPILTRMPDRHPNHRRLFQRAADLTAARLGRAVLGYLATVTLIVTLAPFRFSTAPVHGLREYWNLAGSVMNVVMFVPLGFCYQLTRPAGTPVGWLRVALLGAALSGGIEIAQMFEATRYPSLIDVLCNTTGAMVGAWLCVMAQRHIEGPATVRSLALELPLSGLVYLLIPLMWLTGLASEGGARAWLVLLIVAFAAGIMGTVYAAYLAPAGRFAGAWLMIAVLAWYTVALLPGAIRQPDLLAAGVAIAVGVAWMRSLATSRYREQDRTRRFELPTLRLVLPLFAAFLALSSLWPLDGADATWVGTFALLPERGEPSTASVSVALEHVAAFTLVGYVIAEFYGRDFEHYRQFVWRVIAWGGGLSALLELARGFHPAYRASALMVLFTIGAAAFGGWLYHLQRDHVRALLRRRASSPLDVVTTSSDPVERAPAFP